MEKKIERLAIGSVYPDPNQPRDKSEKTGTEFLEYVKELGNSMAEKGQDNPIIVREIPCEAGEYAGRTHMIVAGECRWKAHTENEVLIKAGTIEAIIRHFDSESDVYLTQIVENDVRKNLSPMARIRSWNRAGQFEEANNLYMAQSNLSKPEVKDAKAA